MPLCTVSFFRTTSQAAPEVFNIFKPTNVIANRLFAKKSAMSIPDISLCLAPMQVLPCMVSQGLEDTGDRSRLILIYFLWRGASTARKFPKAL